MAPISGSAFNSRNLRNPNIPPKYKPVQSWEEFFKRLSEFEKQVIMTKETVRESVKLNSWITENVVVPPLYSNPAIDTRLQLRKRIRDAENRMEV